MIVTSGRKLIQRELTVEAIVDFRANPNARPVHADTYLSNLSEADWTNLRAVATRTGSTDNPLLRCADCNKAVYARDSSRGRRHCYHFAGDHSDCRWSGAVAGNIGSIDAVKFHGQQEGELHKALSRHVADILALDRATMNAGISLRRYTKYADGRYAYPDVFAEEWQGGQATFEIQLSTTHMPVIIRREEFYERAGIRLIWIVGRSTLDRRAFRDIYMRNDGQIFGVDGDVVSAAREAREPRLRLYRLLPGPPQDGFAPHWRNRIVAPDEINWGRPGDRPRSVQSSYDSYLDAKIKADSVLSALRRRFYDALAVADEASARAVWNLTVTKVGGLKWDDLPPSYDTIRALGVLASLRTEALCVPTDIPLTRLPHLVNSMLLEPIKRRCWTRAFELLSCARGLEELLLKPSIRTKCERNRTEAPAGPSIDYAAGAVFNVFFPEGAFYRFSL